MDNDGVTDNGKGGLLMTVTIGTTQQIVDRQSRDVGAIRVEQVDGDLVLGRFVAGAEYAEFAPVFAKFEEAVDANALSLVDAIDHEITEFGLRLNMPGDLPIAIHDVQIWRDGGISFRCKSLPAIHLNGAVQSTYLRAASS
jgi:hypothetical protein